MKQPSICTSYVPVAVALEGHCRAVNAAYALTREDLDTVNDLELAFGCTRLLPRPDQVPQSFVAGNLYTRLAEAIFFGWNLPAAELVFKDGFTDDGAPAAINRCARACLVSCAARHEHKIAAVGFMISLVCELHATAVEPAA